MLIKKANIRFWYITVMVKKPVSIWPWVVTLFRTSRITAWKNSGSFVEPGGSLMQVWGDTGTRGSKILGFQIPGTGGYVFITTKTGTTLQQQSPSSSRKRKPQDVDPGAVAEAVPGLFPWSAVCCYLTGHKQCKHQDFQRPGSPWIHAECGI
jgi:hypothetical protein